MKYIFIAFSIMLGLQLTAQTSSWVEIKSSKKFEKGNSIDKIIEMPDGTIYSLMSKKDKDVLNKHDGNMDIVSTIDLPYQLNWSGARKDDYLYEGAFLLNDKLYIFKSKHNDDKNSQTLSYFPFENGIIGKSVDLIERVVEDDSWVEREDFVVSASPNSKMFVVFSNNTYKKDKSKNSFDVSLFDMNLKKVSTRNFKKFFKEGTMIRNSFKLTDEGDILISYTLKIGEEHKNYIMLLKKDDSEPVHIEINYKSKKITEYDMYLVSDEKAMVTGMYYDGTDKTPSGVFTMFVSLNDGSVYNAFNLALKGELKAESDVKGFGGKSQVLRYVPIQTVKHDDNSVSVVFEQFLYMVTQNSKGSVFTWNINYYLVVARVDVETGKIKHTTIIPKKQSSEAGAFNSVICTQKNNKLYIVFNDHGDNKEGMTWDKIELAKVGNPGSKHAVAKVIVEIDDNGKSKRDILYSEEDDRTSFVIEESFVRINGDLMLFYKLSQSAMLMQDWSKNFHLWNVSIK